jgi:hypothetical protein
LFWKSKIARKVIIGNEAGWFCKSSGYRKVKVYGKDYRAHRIIWDMLNPGDILSENEEVDHIDHDKTNNRPYNLRKVSRVGNGRNMPMNSNNTSGKTGVTFSTEKGKWVAQIKVNYRKIHLGYFSDKNEAIAARTAAEQKYGFHKNHGK